MNMPSKFLVIVNGIDIDIYIYIHIHIHIRIHIDACLDGALADTLLGERRLKVAMKYG